MHMSKNRGRLTSDSSDNTIPPTALDDNEQAQADLPRLTAEVRQVGQATSTTENRVSRISQEQQRLSDMMNSNSQAINQLFMSLREILPPDAFNALLANLPNIAPVNPNRHQSPLADYAIPESPDTESLAEMRADIESRTADLRSTLGEMNSGLEEAEIYNATAAARISRISTLTAHLQNLVQNIQAQQNAAAVQPPARPERRRVEDQGDEERSAQVARRAGGPATANQEPVTEAVAGNQRGVENHQSAENRPSGAASSPRANPAMNRENQGQSPNQ